MKNIRLLFGIFIIGFHNLNAQVRWIVEKPFEQKNFIENVGQFTLNSQITEEKILYAANIDGVEYFFTRNGYVICHKERVKRSEKEIEELKISFGIKEENEKEEKEFAYKLENRLHKMQWNGSNPAVETSAEEEVSNYYSYSDTKDLSGKSTLVAHAFKKITYKNLYPYVDLTFEFPKDKMGIKYALYINPGADISKIKMQFPLNKNFSINSIGDLYIESEFGMITDHKPLAYDKITGQPVTCSFKRSNESVEFHLENITVNSTIIIDPWTITPNFGASNVALDVDYDAQGNVYAYGGVNPVNFYQINQYNSSGNLIWTFTPTIFYNDSYAGDFAVDIYSGNIYIVEGFNPNGAKAIKLNSVGMQLNVFNGNQQFIEMWRIAFSKCTGQAVIAGGGISNPTYQTCYLDSNLTNLTPKQYVVTSECCHDVNMLALDNYGNCYQVTNRSSSGPLFNNQLVKLPLPNLLPIFYNVSTNYVLQEAFSIVFSPGAVGGYSNAYNGITTSNTNVYTSDGYVLKKWEGANGNLLSYTSVHFPANGDSSQIYWGGITSDDCDNIFLGDSNIVQQYNPSQVIINSYTMPAEVYDVKLGQQNKLYVCGNGFLSTIEISGTVGCNVLNYTSTITNATCTIPGSAAINITGGTPPYNIIWDTNPVQTGATLTNVTVGTYIFHISDSSCITQYRTDSVTIGDASIPFTLTSSVTELKCLSDHNAAINIMASGGVSPFIYHWSNNETGSNISNLSAGVYTVTATDAQGCSDTLSVPIQPTIETDSSLFEKINVFSPNADSHNDIFYPTKYVNSYWNVYASDYQLIIFNRWGNIVFTSSSPAKGWNGNFSQNKKAAAGVYYWILSYRSNCANPEEIVYKGFVHLIR